MGPGADAQVIDTALGPVQVAVAGEGPVLLAVHGQPGGCDQALALADVVGPGFRVIAPSRPGYLATPLDGRGGLDDQANLLAAVLDAVGAQDAMVVALSAGGPVALRLARLHPERVRGVVLISSVCGPDVPPITAIDRLFLGRMAGLATRVALRVIPGVTAASALMFSGARSVDAALRRGRQVGRDPVLMRRLAAIIGTSLPYGPRRQGSEADDRLAAALPADLGAGVTTPVLAVHGDIDPEVPVVQARALMARIPASRLIVLGGAGHLVELHPLWPRAQQRVREFALHPPAATNPTATPQAPA